MTKADTILVLNSGSSSIKFNFYEGKNSQVSGQVSGLGASPRMSFKVGSTGKNVDCELSQQAANHEAALQHLLPLLKGEVDISDVTAVGHRVVHGGALHSKPFKLDKNVRCALEDLTPLAPLHQPHNLSGIDAATRAFPNAVQVACFDTAFHRGHPWVNDTFALPRNLYEEGVRRYGFHGLSYEYICDHLKTFHPDTFSGKLVVAHLGNGASMCAIRDGKSIGSTMGFTALDGLPMGTRCGQLDPGVLLYLLISKGMSSDEVSNLLYKESGLKGLSGESQDMRTLLSSSSIEARQAIDYYVFRIRREIGAMAAVLNGVETLVFTGGIGENAAQIREEICSNQDWLELSINKTLNAIHAEIISTPQSHVRVLVIPTNEEEMIRRHTSELLASYA
ncbi:acetate kinase [Roseibium sp. TrichSKD4]|uniref:acetate/propionate family kinase n=1 Tax=Roseibium sp. TrichSKD4 TaxID=744980 RepID=UPI0001E56351|nr:acetate/propionate family kinase [Roseibium sp. TrichSKD4]EFO33144.1 acetate kinase [Roseibium sp. TrichSKD4]